MSEFCQDEPEAVRILEDALDDFQEKAKKQELANLVARVVLSPEDYLPPDEIEAYQAAQQSIFDARESAVRNEGKIIIF